MSTAVARRAGNPGQSVAEGPDEPEPVLVDFELEERFLAWCLIDPTALDGVDAEAFWLPENREVFAALAEFRRERRAVDEPAPLIERLRTSRRLVAAGGEARIRQLFERVEPTPSPRAAPTLKRLRTLRDARRRAFEAAAAVARRDVRGARDRLREAVRLLEAAQ